MKHTILKIMIISICYTYVNMCNSSIVAQDEDDLFSNELLYIQIANKLISYNNQLLQIQDCIKESSTDDLSTIDKRITAIDLKWSLYNQSNQMDIANNDSLLQLSTNFQLIKQELTDSITTRKHFLESKENFKKAESFIFSQDTMYAKLYDDALSYSRIKRLAPTLEKLKIKEQLVFNDIQASYEQGMAIGEEFPIFKNRFKLFEEKYIELKNISDKIQALEYKNLFQRCKDYLLGLAAVSLILMFINVIQTKIKVWKQTAANAKKMKEMFKQNDQDYPTI